MSLSAKQAAEQVGLSKQGIIKAIKQGKLSATKDDNGEWQIDPAELFRVYQPAVHGLPPPTGSTNSQPPSTVDSRLQWENDWLRERIKDKDAVIEDLRRRLDGETFEHRQERERLHGIIEKQTLLLAAPKQEPAPPSKKKRWWHFSR
jgi:hypothetical protein